jgi:hypothetical protein
MPLPPPPPHHLILHPLLKYSIQNNGKLGPEKGAVVSIIPLIEAVVTIGCAYSLL